MDYKDISRLIDKIAKKGITEFELEKDDIRIRICKDPAVSRNGTPEVVDAPLPAGESVYSEVEKQSSVSHSAVEEHAAEEDNFHKIMSPMVGTFYRSPSPEGDPYVEVGTRVKKGQICCIVEAMKLMNEIVIDADGVIAKIHAENAQPVEYGEVLLSIDTSA